MYRYLLVQSDGKVEVFFIKSCAELFKLVRGGGTITEVYVGIEL
jgi:hypothetical protein